MSDPVERLVTELRHAREEADYLRRARDEWITRSATLENRIIELEGHAWMCTNHQIAQAEKLTGESYTNVLPLQALLNWIKYRMPRGSHE